MSANVFFLSPLRNSILLSMWLTIPSPDSLPKRFLKVIGTRKWGSWRYPEGYHTESCHWDSDADTLANYYQTPTSINLSQAKTTQKVAYFLIRWIRVSKHSLMFLICKTKFNFYCLRQGNKWQTHVKELLGMDLNAQMNLSGQYAFLSFGYALFL